MLDGMRWLGLNWDEGPEVGGAFGPYFQSGRSAVYEEYLEKLKAADRVYEKEGALFFQISGEPQVIDDAVRGRVERTEEKDFVIWRSNGTPVFHFVNVVDDIAMKITHVIRGEDHLSNTSKHTELFKAFGAEPPRFAHIPLILKQEGPGKMSKRDTGALIEDYQNRHFLSSALRNYLCLLGWSPKDDREILDINEIIELFDLEQINSNNAKFDEKKLSFINSEYIRALPVETFSWMASPVLTAAGLQGEEGDESYRQKVLAIAQPKVRSLEELPQMVDCFFLEDFPQDEAVLGKITKRGDPKLVLQKISSLFKGLEEPDFEETIIEEKVKHWGEEQGYKPGEYSLPLRFALTGKGMGPALFAVVAVLGKERVLKRLENFLKGSASK